MLVKNHRRNEVDAGVTTKRIHQIILSAVLAAVLGFRPFLSVSAVELTEETQPQTVETAPQETQETEAPTASQTEPTQAPTVPPTEPAAEPTTVPTEAVTVPEETESLQLPGLTEETESTEPSAEPTQSPTVPTETEAPAEPSARTGTFATIAEAWAMGTGTELLTLRGTVVYVFGNQAVLQDSTGGMRLSFSEAPGVKLGDVLEVTGTRTGGFSVTDYEFTGTATLPAVETTLYDAPENIRVRIQNASISQGNLTQSGTSITLMGTLPDSAEGTKADVYGVIIDGLFYADSVVPAAASEETDSESGESYRLYFGQLHAHTDASDGEGTVEEAFAHASQVEGLDFFAVTDHSNSFDNAEAGAIDVDGTTISEEWARGKAAAAAVTDEDFVGIFGYEMTWKDVSALGHINTFNTPGWQTRNQPEFETLESYYQVLTTVPGSISQFNHPGHAYGNFHYFSYYSPAYDQAIQLLEVGSEGKTAYDLYTCALDQGWHVAPTNNQNNHAGLWGDETSVRTVILAEELTEESLFDAIRHYRVYATEDKDLSIRYQMNGKMMGSILSASSRMVLSLEVEDPTDSIIGTVDVIVDGGEVAASREIDGAAASFSMEVPVGYSYYYLRITQPDGDIAVTAPVWVDSYADIGIGSFVSNVEDPLEGEEVTLTLEVFDHEAAEFVLENVEFSMDGSSVGSISDPGTVKAMGVQTYHIPLTCTAAGELQVTATVTGTVSGQRRTYEETLVLRCQQEEESVKTSIRQVRTGSPGMVYQIKGYVTAGNENPYNTFSNMIYLQDDTGGIAVWGTIPEEVAVGDPMIVTGVLLEQGSNLVLKLMDYELTGETAYRYAPSTLPNAVAMNYETNGGKLLQIEGSVVSLTQTANGEGISRFTIKDVRGTLATVVIEADIRSGAHGTNELAANVKKGRTVRAIGLLHIDEYGQTVLCVRNCDEVVYVPPTADPSNPKTGDWFWFWK